MVINIICLGLVGLFITGPDTILSSAVSQELSPPNKVGSVAGFIHAMGSTGTILQGPITSYLSVNYGWSKVFQVLILSCIVAFIMLWPLLKKEYAGRATSTNANKTQVKL